MGTIDDSDDSFDDEDEDCGILKKALDVELPKDFDPNKIPQTGEEYVQHVIYERTKCKTWVTADIDRSKFKNRQTFKVELGNVAKGAPVSLLPSVEWQNQIIDDFTNFRKFIHLKLGDDKSAVTSFDETKFLDRIQHETPQYSEIVSYTQAVKIRMLQIVSKHLFSLEPGSSVGREMGTWVYAILVLLEKPLSPDWCHTLREFAKRCLMLRSTLGEHTKEEIYRPLNIFICIIARFYNQLDLADP